MGIIFAGNIVSGPDEFSVLALHDGKLVTAMTCYLQSTHRHIKKETLWVLSNLTAGPTEHITTLLHAGVLPLVIHLLSSTFDIKKEVCLNVSFVSLYTEYGSCHSDLTLFPANFAIAVASYKLWNGLWKVMENDIDSTK